MSIHQEDSGYYSPRGKAVASLSGVIWGRDARMAAQIARFTPETPPRPSCEVSTLADLTLQATVSLQNESYAIAQGWTKQEQDSARAIDMLARGLARSKRSNSEGLA